MRSTQKRRCRSNRGFTLVEMIVTMMLLSILLTISVMGLMAWQDWSDFNQANEYAETMFLAAQNQLSEYNANGTLEDFAKQTAYREQFDLCVSRAVANLSTLSEYCIPYIRVGGMFVSYKSGTVEDELKQSEKAVSLLGGKIEKTVKFQLPDTEIGRSFVKIKKISETRKKYPRKAGLPAKEPLS